ncbi:MAG: fasciclin domain-containing protein [Planctomycetota bacterium]
MQRLSSLLPLAPAVLAVGLVGCSSDDDPVNAPPAPATVSDVLLGLGLNTLATALQAADLTDDLAAPGPLTLLAPTDAAFAALDPATLSFLLDPANQQALIDVLTYHVLPVEADSTVVSGLSSAGTLLGPNVLIEGVDGGLFLNDARVVSPDNFASNGVIHIIDRVLTPPVSVAQTLTDRGFSTLLAAVNAAGLTGALNGGAFTVLAPTDAAFANLPAGTLNDLLLPQNQAQLISVLQYHLIPNQPTLGDLLTAGDVNSAEGPLQFFGDPDAGPPTVSGVAISGFNVPATDGLIVTVDDVLLAPGNAATVATDAGFSTLVTALVEAGLDGTIANGGPFTIFAPTNAAFDGLPAGLLASLLEPQNQAALQQILTYHVVDGAQQAAEVVQQSSLTTLEGSAIDLSIVGGSLTLNGSTTVTATDVFSDNAVIHVIDEVLVPPGFVAP